MSYSAEISRANPTAFLFLIDQSGSMVDTIPGRQESKAEFLATAINRALRELIIKCSKGTEIRDYFAVGVIGYGTTVGPAFSGALAGEYLSWISEVGMNPARVEERVQKVDDGVGGLIEQSIKFPVWFEPVANGGTPMCQALQMANDVISGWVTEHPDSFPPVIMHFTDGESTDGDPTSQMEALKSLSTSDGQAILFNVHISSTNADPIAYPDSATQLPDPYAKVLFNGASSLTPSMLESASALANRALSTDAKAFVFMADWIQIIEALNIGTRPGNLR